MKKVTFFLGDDDTQRDFGFELSHPTDSYIGMMVHNIGSILQREFVLEEWFPYESGDNELNVDVYVDDEFYGSWTLGLEWEPSFWVDKVKPSSSQAVE